MNTITREQIEDEGVYTTFPDNDVAGEANANLNYLGLRWEWMDNTIEFVISDSVNEEGMAFCSLTREDALELAQNIFDLYGVQSNG